MKLKDMSSDSDTVSKELRSSEYECINQAEIKRTIKTSKTKKKMQYNLTLGTRT